MPSDARPDRFITPLLAGLVVFDTILTVWAGFFPQLWFDTFHGVAFADPEGFLRRMAAQWAAFALLQLVALLRWRRDRWWLVIIAGVRLSDVFTDLVYVISARDVTWFARATLPVMGTVNALIGWALLRAWKRVPTSN